MCVYIYTNTVVERRNDDDTRKGNCCNLWGKKELYEDQQGFILMRRGRGTISWGLTSGTEVAAKARERFSSPLHTYSV